MLAAINFTWWAWAIVALTFAFFEIILPAFVFLGMAIGAASVSLFMLLGGAEVLGGSVAATLVVFAVASLIATLILPEWPVLLRAEMAISRLDGPQPHDQHHWQLPELGSPRVFDRLKPHLLDALQE